MAGQTRFVEMLADCIMRFEGWHPPSPSFPDGSLSWRFRNPGNLRPVGNTSQYRRFICLTDGWNALLDDLEYKLINGGHGITLNSSLHDLFSIYAPALDKNDPQQYSRTVAEWLNQIYKITTITPDTKLGFLVDLP